VEAFTTQEKLFITAKTYQINRGEKLKIPCLQAFNLAPKMGWPCSATHSSIDVAR